MSRRLARRALERAALAWARGLDDATGDGKPGVDMEALDARLFEACRDLHDAATQDETASARARAVLDLAQLGFDNEAMTGYSALVDAFTEAAHSPGVIHVLKCDDNDGYRVWVFEEAPSAWITWLRIPAVQRWMEEADVDVPPISSWSLDVERQLEHLMSEYNSQTDEYYHVEEHEVCQFPVQDGELV